jgi:cyanophycinase
MPGLVALVGSGEFTLAMEPVDRALLEATGRSRPRVAVVPTASWPDGEETFRRWLEQGRSHFAALGAEVEGVDLRTRDDALDAAFAQAIGEADLVYLSGGKPDYLLGVIEGTPVEAVIRSVHERGGVVAGCSAGAMVLGAVQPRVGVRPIFRSPVGWRHALHLVDGVAILPHYDAFPEPLAAALALAAPRGVTVVGIDEETAAVGRDGSWRVEGRGRVTTWRGRRRVRHRAGEVFRLDLGSSGSAQDARPETGPADPAGASVDER